MIVTGTLAMAAWIGIRWLRLDSRNALLVGAGSAVCGAAMLLYPSLYLLPEVQQLFGHSLLAMGRLVGGDRA